MKVPVDLDAAEKDAIARFEAKKAELIANNRTITSAKENQEKIVQDLARLQGEHRAIQNLRAQADTLPTEPQ